MMTPLQHIPIPEPKPDVCYQLEMAGKTFSFVGLKKLLGAADFSKAGDRTAGLAAEDEATREAARTLLSQLTLQHIYDHPLTDEKGKIDSVMRVNYDIPLAGFREIAKWRLGDLKNKLLTESGAEIKRLGSLLTGVMVAAVVKLLDTHELILVAKKIHHITRARTILGLPGTLSSRLQPNHPIDDPRGIALLVFTGLSLGAGDALIGLNPAVDTVENIKNLLYHLDDLRRKTDVPTQICVLSHIKTQLQCLKQGAPVEILFQSLAGTENTNLTEFDISIELLDEAYHMMAKEGPLTKEGAEQFMYFETGQGSEFSYGKHNGIDMTTCEALTYGLARRYDPFMVNNVTGFIGPETHQDNFEMIVSCLQDHCMGKLLGLPMGMAPCYTLHSKITLEGQQMATQLLTAAGATYYMDVYLNTDRMLAYFDTSSHDDQTLREIYHKTPTPTFLEWAFSKGIFVKNEISQEIERGPNWGNPRLFCSNATEWQELLSATPACFGFENAGSRPKDSITREVKIHQAFARAAIYSELDIAKIGPTEDLLILHTLAADKESHLNNPVLGTRLTEQSTELLKQESYYPVRIVVSDGLSAEAVHHNVPELLPVLIDGLKGVELPMGKPIVCRYGRVKLAEIIAENTHCTLVILLIGERPGGTALSARSLSCYLAYHLKDEWVQQAAAQFRGDPNIRFEYTVLSNIYEGGLPPLEAGSFIAKTAQKIIDNQAAGNRLESLDMLRLPSF